MADVRISQPTVDLSDGVAGSTAPPDAIQIAGKDGSGNLQTILTDTLGNLSSSDIIKNSISSGSITVSTTAVAARVSTSNLSNRKMLMISPVSSIVYIGSSSSVTTTTGIPVYPGQVISFSFSPAVTPYLISAVSTSVIIFEGS